MEPVLDPESPNLESESITSDEPTPPPIPGTPESTTDPTPELETAPELETVRELAEARDAVVREIEKRIVGQRQVIHHLLTALFARGHCLFVGVPGLAKTLLISTLAEALNLKFQRIQFTPGPNAFGYYWH